MNSSRDFARAVPAIAVRPRLWSTALVELARFVPDRWWRTRPFLPVPDPALLKFRATTQYGSPDHPLATDDVLTWLRWCKRENRHRAVR